MKSLRARIADDPWDATAWAELADDMGKRDPTVPSNLEEQQSFFEDLLLRYPTAVRAIHFQAISSSVAHQSHTSCPLKVP